MDKIKSRYLGPVRVGKSRYFGKIGVDILGILTWTHCLKLGAKREIKVEPAQCVYVTI